MYNTTGTSCATCTIRSYTCISGLAEGQMKELDKKKSTLVFQKGETIFHSGDPAESYFCVQSGNIQLYRTSQTREQSFSIIGPGAWIGFRDVLAESPYQHSARALTQVTVCKVAGSELRNWVEKRPAFAHALIQQLAGGWRDSEKQSYNLGARKTMERLADFLLDLRSHERPDDHGELNFPHTRETLATLLGTTTESVIRMMSDFKARGYIDFHKGKISLKNERELERLVTES